MPIMTIVKPKKKFFGGRLTFLFSFSSSFFFFPPKIFFFALLSSLLPSLTVNLKLFAIGLCDYSICCSNGSNSHITTRGCTIDREWLYLGSGTSVSYFTSIEYLRDVDNRLTRCSACSYFVDERYIGLICCYFCINR